jgi:hypothetical protein
MHTQERAEKGEGCAVSLIPLTIDYLTFDLWLFILIIFFQLEHASAKGIAADVGGLLMNSILTRSSIAHVYSVVLQTWDFAYRPLCWRYVIMLLILDYTSISVVWYWPVTIFHTNWNWTIRTLTFRYKQNVNINFYDLDHWLCFIQTGTGLYKPDHAGVLKE